MTDYEAERRNFPLEVPEYFNFATEVNGNWALQAFGIHDFPAHGNTPSGFL